MAECEMCGKIFPGLPIDVKIEGAIMQVCAKCARMGEPVKNRSKQRGTGSSRPSTPAATKTSSSGSGSPIRTRPPVGTPRRRYKGSGRRQDRDLCSDYGDVIRDARRKAGMSQQELAASIHEAVSLLQHIETQKMRPTDKVVQKLERTLSITLLEEMSDLPQTSTPVSSGRSVGTTLGDMVKLKKKKQK